MSFLLALNSGLGHGASTDFWDVLFVNLHLASDILVPEHGASTGPWDVLFVNLHLASDILLHEHNVGIFKLDQIVTRNTPVAVELDQARHSGDARSQDLATGTERR